MEPISDSLIDETLIEVNSFSREIAQVEMKELARAQPDLLGFILELTDDLDVDVQELATYMCFVIYRMFQKAHGRQIDRIFPRDLINRFERNEDLMARLQGAEERFFERVAVVESEAQPAVVLYIVESFFGEHDDSVELAEDDIGYLFLVLKTVVDVLDSKT